MSNIKLKDFSGSEIVYNGITEIEVPNSTGRETTVYKELEGVGDTADIKIKNVDGISMPLENVLTIAIPKADDSGDAIYQIEGVPTGITVTTLPTKTTYFDGETLDLTGMVVTLTYATGVTRTITDYTTIPPNGAVLHTSDTAVVVKYENAGTEVSTSFAITVDAVLQSLSIATEPTKVRYYLNETLDLTGLTVRAHYTDGTSRLVSGYTTVPANGATLTTSDTTVSVSYTESGVTKSTSFGIAVVSLQSISIASMPTKTSYNVGDRLDLTGLTVRATYSDGQGRNVTGYTTVPANGATLTASDTYVTVAYTESGIRKTAGFTIDVVTAHIYGATWAGGSSSVWTRTDEAAGFSNPSPYFNGTGGKNPSSPFDNLMPWSGMVKETVSGLGTLVKIPKYWYKWTRNGSAMTLQIADAEVDGFLVSPAHADRGDGKGERDYVYVGRYHCSTSNYQSTSGVKPKASITRATARTSIHNLNANAWQLDYAMWWTVNMLFLVEFADWDSQKVIGYGCGNDSATENSGASDSMPYHTGTMKSSRTTYGVGCQYRYIEDWWGNVLDWCDGVRFSSSNQYVYNNPSTFSDSSGGTNVGTHSTASGEYIKSWNANPTQSGYEYAIFPASTKGSTKAYVCDYTYVESSDVVLCVGGSYDRSEYRGAFCMYGNSSSGSYTSIGCRLQYLP